MSSHMQRPGHVRDGFVALLPIFSIILLLLPPPPLCSSPSSIMFLEPCGKVCGVGCVCVCVAHTRAHVCTCDVAVSQCLFSPVRPFLISGMSVLLPLQGSSCICLTPRGSLSPRYALSTCLLILEPWCLWQLA